MLKRSTITIRDVAKESGFSSSAVSIVLNNAPLARYIPAGTKKRIEKAAKKLGYRPNLFARSLRSKRTHTLGVMVFDMTDPFCTLVLRGIENSLYQASYLPILTDVHNERSRFERYLEMLLDRRVVALIVLANWLFDDVRIMLKPGRNKPVEQTFLQERQLGICLRQRNSRFQPPDHRTAKSGIRIVQHILIRQNRCELERQVHLRLFAWPHPMEVGRRNTHYCYWHV